MKPSAKGRALGGGGVRGVRAIGAGQRRESGAAGWRCGQDEVGCCGVDRRGEHCALAGVASRPKEPHGYFGLSRML